MSHLRCVIFAEAPSFAERMEDQVAVVGTTAVMECKSSGSPQPKLTWLKDGVLLVPPRRDGDELVSTPSPRLFFTASDQLLIIVKTTFADSGNYTCVMSNVLGSDRQVRHSTHVCSAPRVLAAFSSGWFSRPLCLLLNFDASPRCGVAGPTP